MQLFGCLSYSFWFLNECSVVDVLSFYVCRFEKSIVIKFQFDICILKSNFFFTLFCALLRFVASLIPFVLFVLLLHKVIIVALQERIILFFIVQIHVCLKRKINQKRRKKNKPNFFSQRLTPPNPQRTLRPKRGRPHLPWTPLAHVQIHRSFQESYLMLIFKSFIASFE